MNRFTFNRLKYSTYVKPNSSTTKWLMASALVFVPAFIYFTKPPKEYLHKPIKSVVPVVNKVKLPTTTTFKYVLLGGGTAAYAAMQEIRKHDTEGEILMITSEEFIPYERPPLSKELWHGDCDTDQFMFTNFEGQRTSIFYDDVKTYDQVTADSVKPTGTGTKLLTKTIATSLDLDKHTITFKSGHTIVYDKLLLATGATPKLLPSQNKLPQVVQNRVCTYRTLKDYQKLVNVLNSSKTKKEICVVGGGFLGSEMAVALANQPNCNVTQVFPEDGNMGKIFPKYLTRYTTSLIEMEGVTVLPNSLVTDLHYNDTTDQIHVHLNKIDTDTKGFDHVLVAVGVEPNIDLAQSAGLEIDPVSNGILVNAELEARRNVFCAGDNVSFYDSVLGRRRVEHYDNAVSQGKWAGRCMAQGAKPFTHMSIMFWSDLGRRLGYEAVGDLDGSLVTVSVWGVNDISPPPPTDLVNNQQLAHETKNSLNTPETGDKEVQKNDANAGTIENKLGTVLPDSEVRKGVVFYCKDQKIVGVLMMNVRGQADVARDIIMEKAHPSQAKVLAARFDIFGTAKNDSKKDN